MKKRKRRKGEAPRFMCERCGHSVPATAEHKCEYCGSDVVIRLVKV